MIKATVIVILSVLCMCTHKINVRILVPPPSKDNSIHYISVDSVTNAEAMKFLARKMFNQGYLHKTGLICGPILWNKMKTQISFDTTVGKELAFIQPNQIQLGRVFNEKNSKYFVNFINEYIEDKNKLYLMKLTKQTIEYYWALIAWEISEPVSFLIKNLRRHFGCAANVELVKTNNNEIALKRLLTIQ